ncbi:cold shock domain-containing protein [Azospirillum sp.]|uniref:cold shock domain-containing protein n=1 Tax=Azospirillum sp. TaxID=34012 RepID=UPI002D6AA51C|nr:cold shock domain-containing protein [Azospirillum sp.]HYD64179.1 cold shock domain-containing protein [Azospirillum sp.]
MMRQPPRHVYRQPTVLATGVQVTLKWFDPARGFGFVRSADGTSDALLPGAILQAAGHDTLPDGSTLVVDLVGSRKGAQVSALHSVDTSTARPASKSATAKSAPRPRTDAPRGPRPGFEQPERGRPTGDRPEPKRFDRDRPDRGADRDRPDRGADRGPRRGPAPRDAASGPTTEVDGTVKWFDTTKGFGFIAPDGGGRDVFVHVRALERSGLAALNEKQRVHLTVRQGEKGPEAVSVKPE